MTSSAAYFDSDNFEVQWEHATEQQMTRMVKRARYLEPSIGIIPILAGFFSNHASVKNDAADNLEFLIKKIRILLSDTKNTGSYAKGKVESALVSARMFSRISPETPSGEIDFFLRLLLEMGGKGPGFTFKGLYKGIIPLDSMEKTIGFVSETGRLAFVDQYIQARPSVRLKYGATFKHMLNNLGSRSAVIEFYASLFDRHQDADPFLNNIKAQLRNPETIMETELISKETAKKILGLKALSMLLNRIPSNLLLPCLNPEEKADIRITIYSIIENSSMGVYSDLFDSILKLFPKFRGDEALHAFKAMVATGKHPLYRLMGKIHKIYPSLIPVIMDEISSLSKTSFFFIQDIALNKEQYKTGLHLEINHACIFGMIKKRPERVVKIFQRGAGSKYVFKTQETGFIKKILTILANEKKDIASDFLPAISDLSRGKRANEKKGLFRKRLKNPTEKKLDLLNTNRSSKSIDFEGNTISFQNLSKKRSNLPPSFLMEAKFKTQTFPGPVFPSLFLRGVCCIKLTCEIPFLKMSHLIMLF